MTRGDFEIVVQCVDRMTRRQRVQRADREEIVAEVCAGLVRKPLRDVDARGPGGLISKRCSWAVADFHRRHDREQRKAMWTPARAFDVYLALYPPADDLREEDMDRLRVAMQRLGSDDVDLLFSLYAAGEGVVAAGRRLRVRPSTVSRRARSIIDSLRATVAEAA
jgi:DNA-directed RNA polymerase specialized sigma24 family protein